MSENNEGVIFTPKPEEEGRIDEFPESKIEESPLLTPEELEKFSPKEESEGTVEGAIEGAAEEEKELTDEEKRELFIKALKESKIKFHPIKHGVKTIVTEVTDSVLGRKHKVKHREILSNVTTNKFGAAYKQERKRKNRMQKASRKLARKK